MPETLTPEIDSAADGAAEQAVEPSGDATASPVLAETLVEEVSIDGMCGVY